MSLESSKALTGSSSAEEDSLSRPSEIKDKNLVPVGNGIFNRTSKHLQSYTPDLVFTHKILTNYNPNATEPTFNGWSVSKWFKQIADGDHDKPL